MNEINKQMYESRIKLYEQLISDLEETLATSRTMLDLFRYDLEKLNQDYQHTYMQQNSNDSSTTNK